METSGQSLLTKSKNDSFKSWHYESLLLSPHCLQAAGNGIQASSKSVLNHGHSFQPARINLVVITALNNGFLCSYFQ